METKDREEGKKRVEPNGEKRELLRPREREENRETIGGAEAAAFHVAWHRLPLKSLLLFVSSSKIMIVCPRDLLLGGSLDAPCTRVRVYVRIRIYVRTHMCAQGALEEHRDLLLDREGSWRREEIAGEGGRAMKVC